MRYEEYIKQAKTFDLNGWDFSYFIDSGRVEEDDFGWSYESLVKKHFAGTKTLLDMGTGGGELLSSLSPLPAKVYATESYIPNVDIAKSRLEPLGVKIVYIQDKLSPPYNDELPFENSYFDLVINRHEAYTTCEIRRVLKDGHFFITEQVGALYMANLLLDLQNGNTSYIHWNLMSAVSELEDNGFKINNKREQIVSLRFFDIGAVACYLKSLPWLIPDFEPEKYDKQLRFIDSIIDSRGFYQTLSHSFLIIAQKI